MQMHCSASLLKVTACHRCCWKNTGLIQPRNCFKIFESRWIVLSLPNLWFLLLKWDLVKHLVFPWHSLTQHQIWHFHYYGNLGSQSIETSHIKSKSECITEAEYHSLKKNTSRWIFHLTHQKTWWQKNVHSVQCSGAFLYLGKLLFIVSTSLIRFVKGISIQEGEIQLYWSLWYFISAA